MVTPRHEELWPITYTSSKVGGDVTPVTRNSMYFKIEARFKFRRADCIYGPSVPFLISLFNTSEFFVASP